MHFLNPVSLLWSTFISSASAVTFTPDKSALNLNKYVNPLPLAYDLGGSQSFQTGASNSYWSASFVLGSNKNQYLVISHVVAIDTLSVAVRRGSILDITNPTNYKQFSTIEAIPSSVNSTKPGVNIVYDDYAFISTTSDPLGPINTYSTNPNGTFDITFQLSSPVILNGGLGSFPWQETTANEWSIAAGVTTGTFKVKDSTVKVDTTKSLTWYDRQFQPGGASNWTWFALQSTDPTTNTAEKYSIWFYPDGNGTTKGFATVRRDIGTQAVIPATLTPSTSSWTSPRSKNTYTTSWDVTLADSTTFKVKVGRDDQELYDPAVSQVTYEGYVTAQGTSRDKKSLSAFGLVEIQPPVTF